MPFFPEHLTLNTFVVELCLFFADKGLHFIGFLSLEDFKFPWACIVSLVHAF